MSKILSATCVGGVVKVGTLIVPGVEIIGEGVGSSSGLLFIQGDQVTYIPKTSPDLEETLDNLISSIDDVSSALQTIATSITAIAAVTGPTWTPPPTLATDVVAIATKVTSLGVIKADLELLKGGLR